MIKKKIMPLLLGITLGVSSIFYGCSAKDDVKKAGEDVKDSVKDAGDDVKNSADDVKNGTKSLWDKVTDTTMDYSKSDFEKNLEENNIKPEKLDKKGTLFSVESDNYKLNNDQTVDVYEYAITDTDKMSSDLSAINQEGMRIDGAEVHWDNSAHIYKKGRIIVVYDGNDTDTITLLNNILGTPILG